MASSSTLLSVARDIELKLLLDDGDEHIGAYGALDLRLHRLLAGAQEFLDPQVLVWSA